MAMKLMAETGIGCVVTLGGDGTNRAAAKGSRSVPLVPVSTGTNNVFPVLVEGRRCYSWPVATSVLCRLPLPVLLMNLYPVLTTRT